MEISRALGRVPFTSLSNEARVQCGGGRVDHLHDIQPYPDRTSFFKQDSVEFAFALEVDESVALNGGSVHSLRERE